MDKTGSRPLNSLIRGFQDAEKQLFVTIIYLPDNGYYDFQNISESILYEGKCSCIPARKFVPCDTTLHAKKFPGDTEVRVYSNSLKLERQRQLRS